MAWTAAWAAGFMPLFMIARGFVLKQYFVITDTKMKKFQIYENLD